LPPNCQASASTNIFYESMVLHVLYSFNLNGGLVKSPQRLAILGDLLPK